MAVTTFVVLNQVLLVALAVDGYGSASTKAGHAYVVGTVTCDECTREHIGTAAALSGQTPMFP